MDYAALTQIQFLDNPLTAWLYALGGALVAWIAASWILRVATQRLTAKLALAHSPRQRNYLHTVVVLLQSTRRWLILLLVLTLAGETLDLPGHARLLGHTKEGAIVLGAPSSVLAHLAFAICAIQVALWCTALIRVWLEDRLSADYVRVSNPVLVGMLSWILKLIVWAILLLAILANAGMNITAFLASLGVGGIAVALGLQTTLKDVFASISIGLDKPYTVGEFIMFDDVLGTVLKVGARTTRMASLSGEELSISNADLVSKLVHNYSRMPKRRIVFGFRVPYDTPAQTVREIVTQTREFIAQEEQASFDRGHFIAFGVSGYEFEFVYFVKSSDYTLYCDIQQRINFRIIELLDQLDTRFAVPVRVLKTDDGQTTASSSTTSPDRVTKTLSPRGKA